MPNQEKPFYRENHVRNVESDITWIDPHFRDWLDNLYGSYEDALAGWSNLVSITPGEGVVRSLPTGGRVLVYKLPKAYVDPITQLPCFEIDVKGVGETKSGYLQDKDNLDGERKEIMYNPTTEYYFGYDTLEMFSSVVRHLSRARQAHLSTPIPVAILTPRQMVYEGQLMKAKTLRKELDIEEGEDFALLIRAYPISATRTNDFSQWPGHYSHRYLLNNDPGIISRLNTGRSAWSRFELPKIENALRNKLGKNPQVDYFKWLLQVSRNEITRMIQSGLTPATGYESDKAHVRHTHLQNNTSSAAHVEWTPIINVDKLVTKNLIYHLEEVLISEHDYLVNTGAACLPKSAFHLIPDYAQFTRAVAKATNDPRINSIAKFAAKEDLANNYVRGNCLLHWIIDNDHHLNDF